MTDDGQVVGAVAVIGGGIAGVQASLDLADMGFAVHLVESTPSIGGAMAMLDKTFPTNDCSMCILSPKLVDCARHPNITIHTLSEVTGIEGRPGNFTVNVRIKPRYVNISKCTSCGECERVCPIKIPDDFDQGLRMRKAAYKYYPQAIPNTYAIDKDGKPGFRGCINCMLCVKACKPGAIDHSQKAEDLSLNVGAVILAVGARPFDPTEKKEFGYGRYKNVLTSLQFERVLSASGPYQGKVLRPSDMKPPQKIAWVQCVGSRDKQVGNEQCSAMCCMYTAKEAVIAKEHDPNIQAKVFYIDVRSFGKDFDRYVERAKEKHGIEYVRSRISEIEERGNNDLLLRYEDECGELCEELFDMVVLSIGLCMDDNRKAMLEGLGLKKNPFGFAFSTAEDPIISASPGVFLCGSFQEPQAIPESVMQASAAASHAAALLRKARGTLVKEREVPPERDISGEEPRIGVFICHCGINIGSHVDVPKVVEHARLLPNVVLADQNMYTCSEDTQKKLVEAINEHRLNRVVIAACTPRTHEPLFKRSMQEAGLNPHLLEMTNIREHVSWVHKDNTEATRKAMALLEMTIAKTRLLSPIPPSKIDVTQRALVIGGGVAGMTAALSLSQQGYETVLVEKERELGGRLSEIGFTIDGIDPAALLTDLRTRLSKEERIKVHTSSVLKDLKGYVGNYTAVIGTPNGSVEYKLGVIVTANGAVEHRTDDHHYGKDPRIMLLSELEDHLGKAGPGAVCQGETFVFIQCAGSREGTRNYCSRVCCMGALKNAVKIKELNPRSEVYILYRDLMTYGFLERYYTEARERGVVFLQYELSRKPEVLTGERIKVRVHEPLLQQDLELSADHVVLSTGMDPSPSNVDLAKMLKVPLTQDGFFLEAHVKLRPTDFSTRGIFLAGACHSPKSIPESIYQGQAAAARAATLLSKPYLEAEPYIAKVEEDLCSGCRTCISLCPYLAIDSITEVKEGVEVTHARVNEGLCQGCGTCVAACPSGAIHQMGFRDDQLMAMIKVLAGCTSVGGGAR